MFSAKTITRNYMFFFHLHSHFLLKGTDCLLRPLVLRGLALQTTLLYGVQPL